MRKVDFAQTFTSESRLARSSNKSQRVLSQKLYFTDNLLKIR